VSDYWKKKKQNKLAELFGVFVRCCNLKFCKQVSKKEKSNQRLKNEPNSFKKKNF
jgi:hypothetical protein